MEAQLAIQEFLEYVVAQLIRHPEDASIIHDQKGNRHSYRIRLHPDDAGRVIGRSGKTIDAIRSLAIAAGQKNHLKVEVELEESGSEGREEEE